MSKFYTEVSIIGNTVYCKEITNGKSKIHKVQYQPSFYIPSNDTDSQYRSMDGRYLAKKQFNNIYEAKEFIKRYKDVDNHEFFGNTNFVSQFICDAYPEVIDFDFSHISIWTLDLETKAEDGFPHPMEASQEIILATMLNNQTKKYITWGTLKYNQKIAESLNIDFDVKAANTEYRYFDNEVDMLNDFLYWWRNTSIDCLTDWNGESFDLPYLINRITRVLGEDAVTHLSPFKKVSDTVKVINDKEMTTYRIHGISHIDYLPLYKKFGAYNAKESYKLDFIGQEELGIRKIDVDYAKKFKDKYSGEFDIIDEPSESDSIVKKLAYKRTQLKKKLEQSPDVELQKKYDEIDKKIKEIVVTEFVIYNWRDCEIVDKLEDKMGLLQLAYTIAYDAKCLPNDVFSPVKTWDCMMYRFMLEKNIIISQKKKVRSWSIEGAYVKEPKPGQYKWIASFDAASLYPTIIMEYNMSPETLVEKPMLPVTVDGLIERKYDLSELKKNNFGMSANGQMFKNDVEGLFPEIVAKQFGDRKMYKKKMQNAESELELVKAEMKKRGLHD